MSGAALRRESSMEGGESVSPRHFIDIRDHDGATLRRMLEVAAGYKRALKSGAATPKPVSYTHLRAHET